MNFVEFKKLQTIKENIVAEYALLENIERELVFAKISNDITLVNYYESMISDKESILEDLQRLYRDFIFDLDDEIVNHFESLDGLYTTEKSLREQLKELERDLHFCIENGFTNREYKLEDTISEIKNRLGVILLEIYEKESEIDIYFKGGNK